MTINKSRMTHKILIIVLSLLFIACGRDKAVVKVELDNAGNKDIILSQLQINKINVVDTLRTDGAGNAKYKITLQDKSPNFYYLSYDRKRLASLIVNPGDKITVKCDTLGNGLEIRGSEESLLLKQIDEEFLRTINRFDSLSIALVDAIDVGNEEETQNLRYELGALYVKQKRSAIKRIMTNPYSFTNFSLLYQKFNSTIPVFADANDGLMFKRVYDSIQPLYPSSIYVQLLEKDIKNFENTKMLNERLSQAEEMSFPNISLPDVNAKNRDLAELSGKPFILVFWTCGEVAQKMFNLDLLDLYNKYKEQGLEIYQVCVDIDKTLWATTIKEQKLPWINVCDGLGTASLSVSLFNISKVPAMFIYDKDGNVKGRDVFDKAKLDGILSGIVK